MRAGRVKEGREVRVHTGGGETEGSANYIAGRGLIRNGVRVNRMQVFVMVEIKARMLLGSGLKIMV